MTTLVYRLDMGSVTTLSDYVVNDSWIRERWWLYAFFKLDKTGQIVETVDVVGGAQRFWHIPGASIVDQERRRRAESLRGALREAGLNSG